MHAETRALNCASSGMFHERTRHDSTVRPKPIIWKPRYASRRMRENAWASADIQRERTVRATPRRRSLLARLLRR